jgi:drug/metabolite transporter (DMT)-like permease
MLFLAMCLIWGLPYLLIKVAVADLSPASLVFLRTGIGALALLPIAIARGRLRELLPHWPGIVAFGLAEVAVPWLLLSDAERHLSSSLPACSSRRCRSSAP